MLVVEVYGMWLQQPKLTETFTHVLYSVMNSECQEGYHLAQGSSHLGSSP